MDDFPFYFFIKSLPSPEFYIAFTPGSGPHIKKISYDYKCLNIRL